MKYNEKVEHAERTAENILNRESLVQIREDLAEKGLYPVDVDNVIASAKNILGEKFKPSIKELLLSGEPLSNLSELAGIDDSAMDLLVQEAKRSIVQDEKKKVRLLLKSGMSREQILQDIRTDFYAQDLVDKQIAHYNEGEGQDSAAGRTKNIGGGLLIMAAGIGITMASQNSDGRTVYYGLILVGLFMVVRGFMTSGPSE